MYQYKVLKVDDFSIWVNDDLSLGAGPNIQGSRLVRTILVEVSNGIIPLFTREVLVDEPINAEKINKAIERLSLELPARNENEGIVIGVDYKTLEERLSVVEDDTEAIAIVLADIVGVEL